MLHDIVEVKPLGDHRLWLRFDDGAEGSIDLSKEIRFDGVFEPLKDPAYFARVQIHPELGTICWPNDVDLDPLVLYSLVTGIPVPDYGEDAVADGADGSLDSMMHHVVEVKPVYGHRLWLRFDDGAEGEIDLWPKLAFEGVFAALKDPRFFARVTIDEGGGTICWPNDADIDPVVLYSWLTGKPIPGAEGYA